MDHRPIGIIQCAFDQNLKFTTQEKNLLQQFAYQISMAISKIQLQNLESGKIQRTRTYKSFIGNFYSGIQSDRYAIGITRFISYAWK